MNSKLVQTIIGRDAWCWHCGTDTGLVIHHRKNRGMGGSKKLDRADNLIRVCAGYNFAMESDPDIAEDAREKKHKLGSWDGFDTPLFDNGLGAWFILTEKGEKLPSQPPQFLI